MTTLTIASATVTAAGPIATPLDISGVSGDFTLLLTVLSLTAASGTPAARIVFEDSVNAFTNLLPAAIENVQGPVVAGTPVASSWRRYEVPSLRAGTANAVARVNVAELNGTTPSLTILAQLVY